MTTPHQLRLERFRTSCVAVHAGLDSPMLGAQRDVTLALALEIEQQTRYRRDPDSVRWNNAARATFWLLHDPPADSPADATITRRWLDYFSDLPPMPQQTPANSSKHFQDHV